MSDTFRKSTIKPLTLQVHPDGDDRRDGSLSRPHKSQSGPVATLDRAQELVAEARKLHPQIPIRVVLHGGRYELGKPLLFGPDQGGSAAAPVTWAAAAGEQPVISGAREVRGWREDTINGVDCLTADLPADLNPLQLFVDGRRAERPRLPKQGYFRFKSTFGKRCQTETLWGEGPDEAEYEAGDLKNFHNLAEVRLVVMGAWYDMWMRPTAIDESRRAVKFHRDCWQRLVDETGRSSRYFVENVAEALTEPGEWYHDRTAGKIYYIPRPGQTQGTITAYVPIVDRLLHIRGKTNLPVAHLRFENLAFQHCDWHPPEDFRGSIQAGHLKPGALLFEDAESCVLYGCEVSQVAQFGVQLGQGSRDCRVVACTLHDLGAGGVHVDHEWLKPHSIEVADSSALRKPDLRPRRATISDCTIREGGRIYRGAVGIFVGNASHNRILNNHVHDFFYSGISVGWTWGLAPTACVDNRIENNHVHHCNWDRTFSDLGLIYTLGAQPGSTIRGNHLHHVSSYGYGGEGIYNDEGSSGFVIENNVIYRCRHAGYSGAARDVVVRNNVFAFCEESQVNPAVQGLEYFGTVFERNIIIWNEGTCGNPAPFGWTTSGTLARDNVMWAVGVPLRLTDGHDLAYWQERGQLLGTLVSDPLFVDPCGGDFRLRSGSPAVAHGFTLIDLSNCGPRGGAVLPATYAEWLQRFPDPKDQPVLFARLDQVDENRLRLRIQNPGVVAASGVFKWEVPSGLELASPKQLRVPLEAGKEKIMEVTVAGAPGLRRLALWPSRPLWAPALCVVEKGMPSFEISRVRPVKGSKDVERALRDVAEVILRAEGRELGFVRIAHTGMHLVVAARLIDARVRRVEKNFWEGSCFEVFMAPQFRAQPVQIVLLPDIEKRRMLVHRQHMFTPVPLAGIDTVLRRLPDGYSCQAVLPLELFGVKGTDGIVSRLEIAAGVHATAESQLSIKATLFGAEQPSRITRGMARVAFL